MSNLTDSTPGGSNLAGAVEGTGINKGELFSSYDVDAFEVPGGRDELWRFTPLRRLRGLHDGTAVARRDRGGDGGGGGGSRGRERVRRCDGRNRRALR